MSFTGTQEVGRFGIAHPYTDGPIASDISGTVTNFFSQLVGKRVRISSSDPKESSSGIFTAVLHELSFNNDSVEGIDLLGITFEQQGEAAFGGLLDTSVDDDGQTLHGHLTVNDRLTHWRIGLESKTTPPSAPAPQKPSARAERAARREAAADAAAAAAATAAAAAAATAAASAAADQDMLEVTNTVKLVNEYEGRAVNAAFRAKQFLTSYEGLNVEVPQTLQTEITNANISATNSKQSAELVKSNAKVLKSLLLS